MKKVFVVSLASIALLASCVSKKKYVALEDNLAQTQSQLTKTQVEKEELQAKVAKIEARVAEYNAKINSLKEVNENQFDLDNGALMSKTTKAKMEATLAKVDPTELAAAKTMEDSVNLAISYNLKNAITENTESDDIDISVDKTVVMINVSDKLLFNTAGYTVNKKADGLLSKLAEVIKSEPSMEVMVEGHTDSRTINTALFTDNWDLSVKRATSVVRALQEDYSVNPEQLIAAGRSKYQPLVDNTDNDAMAKNRRTRIVIIPNLDKFFALLESDI